MFALICNLYGKNVLGQISNKYQYVTRKGSDLFNCSDASFANAEFELKIALQNFCFWYDITSN